MGYLHSNYTFEQAVAMTIAEIRGVPYQDLNQDRLHFKQSQPGNGRVSDEDTKGLPIPRAELEQHDIARPEPIIQPVTEQPKHRHKQSIDELYREKLADQSSKKQEAEKRQIERLRLAANRSAAYKKKQAHGRSNVAGSQGQNIDPERLKRQLLQQKRREDEQLAELERERHVSKQQRDILHAQFIQKQAAEQARRRQLYEKYHSIGPVKGSERVTKTQQPKKVGKSPFNQQLQDELKKWQEKE